ncbi:MFS transporter [Pseudogracilibacillus sp. SO30301A]|uniref:MFS transporter n=1 Tax=Pseudogracilibacillus sp. SO30301A TaxID=3098291 RepID=UPI00300E42CF
MSQNETERKELDVLIEDPKEKLLTKEFLFVCMSALFFWSSVFFHGTLFPLYLDGHGYSEATVGFVVGSGALAALVGRVLSGWTVDKWGTRLFVFWGAIAWAITSPFMALTTNIVLLTFFHLIQGFGLAIFLNASLAQMAKVAPEGKRGAAVGWWGITNNLSSAIGPVIAIWIMQDFGWFVAFVTAGVTALFSAILGLLPTEIESSEMNSETEENKFRVISPKAVLPGMVGAALGFASGGYITFAPLIARDLGLSNVGIYLMVLATAMVVARMTFGPLSDKKGRKWAILPGLLLIIVSMILIGMITHSLLALIVPFLFGLGIGGAMPGLIAWTLDRSKATESGLAGSTFYFIYEIGMFFGPIILGILLEVGNYYSYLVIAAIIFIVMLFYLYSLRQEKMV